MANYTENFNSKLDWAMPFQRTGAFPLDRTDLFDSYADAVKYAAGNVNDPDKRGLCGSSYVGQQITVFENGTVTHYTIMADRTLQSAAKDKEDELVYSKIDITADTADENKFYLIDITE